MAADKLDNSLYHQGGWVCPAASAALPFLVRLAADPQVTVRVPVVELIARIAALVPLVAAQWVDPAWPDALEAATPALLSLLDDADPAVRRAAAHLAGVGGLREDLVIPALQARFQAELDPVARWDVVISLGAAAAGSARAGEVKDELSAMARDGEDPQLRLAAVHGLAAVGEPVTGHAGLMVGALADAGWTSWQRSEWFGGGHPAAIVTETGRLLLEEPTAAAAFAAGVSGAGDARQRIAALGHVGALLNRWHTIAGSVPSFLAGQLDALEPEVRFRAAYLLASIGAGAMPWAAQLAGLATDAAAASYRPEVTVGDAAVWALVQLGDPRCLPGLRERLLGNRIGFATASAHYPLEGPPIFDLPGIGVMVTLADPGAQLFDPVLSRLRRAARNGEPVLAGLLCEPAGAWGAKAAPMVPELRRLLQRGKPGYFPSPAAAHALGRIGPDAQIAVAELRDHAMAGVPEAAWALWRVTGQTQPALSQLTALAAMPKPGAQAVRFLADFTALAAASQARLLELLHDQDEWLQTQAAWALWRITGEASTAVSTLTGIIQPLADGRCRAVHLAAMRYLATIGEPSGQATNIAQAILANPKRLAYAGGWRTFDYDDQLRAAAVGYLTSQTAQGSGGPSR